jgi:pilus assembly protein Flp/PilA
MKASRFLLRQFRRDQSAATAVEYGLIAALIAVAIIAALFQVGNDTRNLYSHINNNVSPALNNQGN